MELTAGLVALALLVACVRVALGMARYIGRRRRCARGIEAHLGLHRYQLDELLEATGLSLDELEARLEGFELIGRNARGKERLIAPSAD